MSNPTAYKTTTTTTTLGNGRNEIHVDQRDIPTITSKAWDEIIAQNNPPIIFRRGGELVQTQEKDNGDTRLITMNKDHMRGFLSRRCFFTEAHNGQVKVVEPPFSIVADMMVNIDSRIPIIDRIVRAPIFAFDDSIIDTPGYHGSARVYCDMPLGLTIPPVSDIPDDSELAAARALFDEMLCDFPFEGAADRAHAYALCLQMFCRDKIDGPTPMYGSESPVVGSGKGKLVDALLIPSLGLKQHTISQPGDDDEWRKQLISSLSEGPPVVKIDNVTRPMDSGVFANVLTTDEFGGRILGSMMNASLPVRCAWVMTANNPILSMEIARRYVRMRLVPDVARPWLRDVFKHDDLIGWVMTNRGRLIWAALTMIRYGIQHNPHNMHRIGSFEKWADVLGNILDAIGVCGFLTNINDIYEQSDVETTMWTNLVSVWWDTHKITDMLASELYTLAEDNKIDIPLHGKNEHALKISMGRAVAKMKDRVFSIDVKGVPLVVRIVKCTQTINRSVLWRLDNITPDPPLAPMPDVDVNTIFDDYERERLAVEAAEHGDYELAETLIDLIADTDIRDRTTIRVDNIQAAGDI